MYHEYHDPWYACIWNNYRVVRLLVSLLGVRCVEQLADTNIKDRYQHFSIIVAQMIDETCTSIPYFFGYPYQKPDGAPCVTRVPLVASGVSIIWPIFHVGKVMDQSSQQYLWLITRMDYIWKYMGIQLGRVFADILRGKLVIDFNAE